MLAYRIKHLVNKNEDIVQFINLKVNVYEEYFLYICDTFTQMNDELTT